MRFFAPAKSATAPSEGRHEGDGQHRRGVSPPPELFAHVPRGDDLGEVDGVDDRDDDGRVRGIGEIEEGPGPDLAGTDGQLGDWAAGQIAPSRQPVIPSNGQRIERRHLPLLAARRDWECLERLEHVDDISLPPLERRGAAGRGPKAQARPENRPPGLGDDLPKNGQPLDNGKERLGTVSGPGEEVEGDPVRFLLVRGADDRSIPGELLTPRDIASPNGISPSPAERGRPCPSRRWAYS